MEPLDDFEHQLLLSGFFLTSHALKRLGQAGLLDNETRELIRAHLELLSAKVEAVPAHQQPPLHTFLDLLTAILPPRQSGDGSPTSE